MLTLSRNKLARRCVMAYFRHIALVWCGVVTRRSGLTAEFRKRTALSAAIFAATAAFACDAAEKKDAPRSHQLLLGLGFSAPFNLEEPFINMAQTRAAGWSFQTKGRERLEDGDAALAGWLDPNTFMPTKESRSAKFVAAGVFLPGAENFPDYYADDYVLDWKGEARGTMQRWDAKGSDQRRANSVAYSLKPFQATGGSLRFSEVGDGLSDVRLYRKKYAALLDAGEIWNPAFIDYVKRYDIIRTMDIQSTNNIQARRFDQIATMDEPWGQRATMAWPEPPFFSAPYEILFDLAVKADVAIWLTIPPQIGSPVSSADPSLRREEKPSRFDGQRFKKTTAAHAKATLASEEWEIFAKEFADRYMASGYPLRRPLYVEIGNEIWNFAGGFSVSSNYAIGIAHGVNADWQLGHGYGVLTARFMLALEQEFAARKAKPNIVYVVASHTTNPWRTKLALDGFSGYLKSKGADPKDYLPKTGVAVTNYYGHFDAMSAAMFGSDKPEIYAPLWRDAIREDPEAFAGRVSTLLKSGPKNVKANGPWVVARWAEHQRIAEQHGSRLIGAYEGGSHLVPPKELANSKDFLDWWTVFHWGEDGADIARQVNRDLIEAFPGAIIANYESIGAIQPGKPWIDGHYAKPTPMLKMWDEFARPDRLDAANP